MTEDDKPLIHSPLSQTLTRDGKSIEVHIYDDGKDGWILETVDQYGNSVVWKLPFPTDTEALDELLITIEEEGIDVLIGLQCFKGAALTSWLQTPYIQRCSVEESKTELEGN